MSLGRHKPVGEPIHGSPRAIRITLGVALVGLAAVLGPHVDTEFSWDLWVETQHLQAAESFAREGFLAHRFTPYTQLSPLEETPPAYRVYYTRTQQLSYVFFGWLYGLGVESLVAWRLLATLLTMAGVLCFYAMLRAGGVSPPISSWSTLVLAWVPALGVWGHNFALIYCAMPGLTFGSIALWLRLQRGFHLPTALLLWLLLFLQGLATQHTYMMTTQLFFWTWALLERKWSWGRALVWFTPHVAALGVVVAKNVWLLGGLGPALVDDILAKVLWRMFNLPVASNTPFPFDWETLFEMLWRQVRWAGALTAAFIWCCLVIAREERPGELLARSDRRMVASLLVPAVIYAIVFRQEVYVHIFHARNLMAGFALLAGIGIHHLWRFSLSCRRPRKILIIGVICVALLAQLRDSWRRIDVRFCWVTDARQLSEQIAEHSDLVLTCFTDSYPFHYLLGKPFVFLRPPGGNVSTHPWWLFSEIRQLEELDETVRTNWPGKTVGLVLVPENASAQPLRRRLVEQDWTPTWSTPTFEIYLLSEQPATEPTAETFRRRPPSTP